MRAGFNKTGVVVGIVILLTACSLQPGKMSQQPSGRFYTWMDAQGRLHTDALPADAAPAKAEAGQGGAQAAAGSAPAPARPAMVPGSGVAAAPATSTPATSTSAASTPAAPGSAAAVAAASEGAKSAASEADSAKPEVFAPDDSFVDSEVLEKKHFNLEDKKKFAYVPDANGTTHIVYFDAGQGQEAPPPPPVQVDDSHWAAGTLAAGLTWQPLGCCEPRLAKHEKPEELLLGRSYHVALPVACAKAAGCAPVIYKLPAQGQDYVLRLASYMSQSRCKRCLQWPRALVLDGTGKVLRGYAADLGGYNAETWRSFASFYYDMAMQHAVDRYLVLLPPAASGMTYKNKSYTFTENGEIAFSLLKQRSL